jgi:hypothetical protein
LTNEETKQFKIQICKLTAKLAYLCGIVNLFTDGYANCRHNKDYGYVEFEFAKSKYGWESRLESVTGNYIRETMYYRLNESKEWAVNDRKKVIPKLKSAIETLEKFIDERDQFNFEKELDWYTEVIKYKVFNLDYEKHINNEK